MSQPEEQLLQIKARNIVLYKAQLQHGVGITILKCICGELHPSALTLKPPGRFVFGNVLGL
jgi:hypothetical protein